MNVKAIIRNLQVDSVLLPITDTYPLVADKALGSIKKMVRAKNRVIFDEDENGKNISMIYNKVTGVKIPIDDNPRKRAVCENDRQPLVAPHDRTGTRASSGCHGKRSLV